jgi:sec-independent protein translocase protein TatB
VFEVGFSELVLILLISLLVLGPQKLPKLARDVGRWVGRARGMARQLREQLDHEQQIAEWAEEDKRRNAAVMNSPPPTDDTYSAAHDVAAPAAPAVAVEAPPVVTPAEVSAPAEHRPTILKPGTPHVD